MSTRTRHSRRGRSRSGKATATTEGRTPRTGTAPTGKPTSSGTLAPVRRVLGGVKGAVITAGALAVAISAIIALVPKGTAPPSAFRASFIPPIQVYPNTTLDEYAARVRESTAASVTTTTGGHLPSYHLAADVTQIETTSNSTDSSNSLGAGSSDSTSSSETTTGTPTETTDTSTTTSTSSACTETASPPGTTASTTTSDTCASPRINLGVTKAGAVLHFLGAAPDVQTVAQQIQLVQRCPLDAHEVPGGGCLPNSTQTCPPTGCTAFEPESYDTGSHCTANINAGQCGLGPLINRALGDGVEPPAAARKVVSLFAASRGEVTGHTVHPLGVMITFGADLVGFEGTRATIRWSLFSHNPAQQLDPEWYRTIPILSVTPDRDDQQISSQFWVPEPRRRGDYYVRLEVDSADGHPVAFLPSPDFH